MSDEEFNTLLDQRLEQLKNQMIEDGQEVPTDAREILVGIYDKKREVLRDFLKEYPDGRPKAS